VTLARVVDLACRYGKETFGKETLARVVDLVGKCGRKHTLARVVDLVGKCGRKHTLWTLQMWKKADVGISRCGDKQILK
jgi:hypothetical protein